MVNENGYEKITASVEVPGGAQVKRRTRAQMKIKRKAMMSKSRNPGLVISTYQSWDIDLSA